MALQLERRKINLETGDELVELAPLTNAFWSEQHNGKRSGRAIIRLTSNKTVISQGPMLALFLGHSDDAKQLLFWEHFRPKNVVPMASVCGSKVQYSRL